VIPEFDNPLTRTLVRLYRPFVHFALSRPALTLMTAVLAVASCVPIVLKLAASSCPVSTKESCSSCKPRCPAFPRRSADAALLASHTMSKFGEVATVSARSAAPTRVPTRPPYSDGGDTIRLAPRSSGQDRARALVFVAGTRNAQDGAARGLHEEQLSFVDTGKNSPPSLRTMGTHDATANTAVINVSAWAAQREVHEGR